MKRSILVTTHFSDSSRNALDYACAMSNGNFDIIVLHIYTMPVSLAAEGIVLETMEQSVRDADTQMEEELQRVREAYPALHITGKVAIGGFMLSLKQYVDEIRPEVLVMGSHKDYEDLWAWSSNILDALTDLPVPVLIVPQHNVHHPIKNVGFACDFRNKNDEAQISFVKRLLTASAAQLHVIHVSRTKVQHDEMKEKNEKVLQALLLDVSPQYHLIEDPNVIEAIARFVKEHNLDMLIVIPHRRGFWESLFTQSHTRQLAKLNDLPILALHD